MTKKVITNSTELREAILALQKKQSEEGAILKEKMHLIFDQLRPINLIKNTLKEVTASDELKNNFINTSVSISTGYLLKKIFESVPGNPLKDVMGTAMMFGINNILVKHPNAIKSISDGVLNLLSRLKSSKVKQE